MKRSIIATLAIVAGAAALLLFGPSQIGGSVSYVITSGNSMSPGLHEGDLVLVRQRSDYQVGDVVAYRDKELGSVLLHRIIDIEGSRYVLQGDNNDFIDSYEPVTGDLIGERWLMVPQGGKFLRAVTRPEIAAAIAAVLAGSILFRRRRRSAGTPTPTAGVPDEIVPPTESFRRAAPPVLVGLGVFLVLGMFAFNRPADVTSLDEVSYESSGRFDYRADAEEGSKGSSVYEDGIVRTGDPIYRALVGRVDFDFSYDFETQAPAAVTGTIGLEARLSSADGWNKTLVLAAPAGFEGRSASTSGTLNLNRVARVLEGIEARTGFSPGLYNLDVVPQVGFLGTLEGREIEGDFSPPLKFSLDASKLQLAQAGIDVSEASGVNPRESGSIEVETIEPAQLSLLGWHVAVDDARRAALAGGTLFALLAALLGLFFLRALRSEDEALQILSRYGDRFVPVKSLESLHGLPAVELTSIEALIKLADSQERMVLYVPREPVGSFVLEQGGVVYYYATAAIEVPVPGIEVPVPAVEAVDGVSIEPPPPPPPAELWLDESETPVEIDVR